MRSQRNMTKHETISYTSVFCPSFCIEATMSDLEFPWWFILNVDSGFWVFALCSSGLCYRLVSFILFIKKDSDNAFNVHRQVFLRTTGCVKGAMALSGRERVSIVRWTADLGKGDRLPILPLVTNFYIEDGASAFLQNIDNATKRQKVQEP
jgi:hypothetical protein